MLSGGWNQGCGLEIGRSSELRCFVCNPAVGEPALERASCEVDCRDEFAVNLIVFRFWENKAKRICEGGCGELRGNWSLLLCFRQSCVCNKPALKAIEGQQV